MFLKQMIAILHLLKMLQRASFSSYSNYIYIVIVITTIVNVITTIDFYLTMMRCKFLVDQNHAINFWLKMLQ
jgi:hypothetical protein